MLYPITFSIPEEKFVNYIPKKTKIISNLLPGQRHTYIYENEEDYYNEYRKSMFAITMKKAGWDCMRHYEIIVNRSIPFFINLDKCPPQTMSLLPKDLLVEGNNLFNKILTTHGVSVNLSSELSNDIILEYNILSEKLFNYAKDHLTTTKIALYILDKIEFKKEDFNILFLSSSIYPDYLRCLTLHGFKSLVGRKCHDYSKIPHIYKSEDANHKKLYGKGISYTNLLDAELHDEDLDDAIEEKIRNKYFNIVIYGAYHSGMPFFQLVEEVYKPSEVVLLCGEDLHKCNNSFWTDKGYNVFVREL